MKSSGNANKLKKGRLPPSIEIEGFRRIGDIMKLDEKRLIHPYDEGERIVTERDLNPNYDERIDLTSHVGKEGEIVDNLPAAKRSQLVVTLMTLAGMIYAYMRERWVLCGCLGLVLVLMLTGILTVKVSTKFTLSRPEVHSEVHSEVTSETPSEVSDNG